jgi:hypothetical protein
MSTEDSMPTNRSELNDELKALLQGAYDNGLDVEGGWECRNGTDHPDWDIVITEVQKPDTS